MNATFTPGTYAIAHNLIGFRSTTLRVKIERIANESNINVRTADLLDAGTPLTLDPVRHQLENEVAETYEMAKGGLVIFA